MKTNTSKNFSTQNLKFVLDKLLQQFNQLSESTMNPLLTGIFLLGISCAFFPVSMVGYLAVVFGVSSGLAYAVAKKQINLQLPTWGFSAIGVAAALVYAFAGIPGVILTAGLSGGWYVHSHYSDKIQEWKTDFQKFIEDVKINPVQQVARMTFLLIQFLSELTLKIEDAEPEQVEELEEVIKQQNNIDTLPPEQHIPDTMNLNTTLEQTPEKLEQESPVLTPNIEVQEMQKEPLPVLFSEQAQQATTVAPVTEPQTKPTTTKVVKPKKDTFKILGQPVLEVERKQVQIDHSWLGLGKAFIYSLDPRVDLMNGQEKLGQEANSNRRRI